MAQSELLVVGVVHLRMHRVVMPVGLSVLLEVGLK